MKNFIYILLVCLSFDAMAQDLHFSQFYSTPLMTNPANTGRMKEDFRLSGIHRRQWMSVNSAFLSTAFSGDINFSSKLLKRDKVGVGIVAYNDNLADGTIKGNSIFLSGAYHRMLDLQRRHRLSGGIQLGYTQKAINDQYFQFPNQYQNFTYVPTLASNENLSQLNYHYFDAQAGLAYNFVITPKTEAFTGVSFYQLRQPKESIYSSNPTGNKLGTRWTSVTGVNQKLSERMMISPQFMYMRQSVAHDLNLGAFVTYHLVSRANTNLIGGAFYRVGDAAILLVGTRVKNIECRVSYDATTSSFKAIKGAQGTGSNDPKNASSVSNKTVNAWEISINIYGFLPRSQPKDFTVPCGIF